MDYMTVRRAAEKWNLSPGAYSSCVPRGEFPARGSLERPGPSPPMRKSPPIPNRGRLPLPEIPRAGGRVRQRDAHAPDEHPLLAGPLPGDGQAMAEGPQRDIALAEYHYFSGRPEQAALEVEP